MGALLWFLGLLACADRGSSPSASKTDTAETCGEEVCDGFDNDCDGIVDEGVGTPWFPDSDSDGFGDAFASGELACEQPDGAVEGSDDCDDSEAAVHPDATEVCDRIDNDCDGQIDPACTVLISSNNTIYTFDLIDKIEEPIAEVPESGSNHIVDARGLCRTGDGRIAVLNRTTSTTLSLYDPETDAWEHHESGLFTPSNSHFAGIACTETHVFLPTYDEILRFTLADSEMVTFGSGSELVDVSVAPDGRIYVIPYNGDIVVYDGDSLEPIDTISPKDTSLRAIAVTEDALLYANNTRELVRLNLEGEELARISIGSTSGFDITIAPDGRVLISGDYLRLTDLDLSTPETFSVPHYSYFITFGP